jgi:cyclopropane fatty-acyl-phospholipid synthase-like methyltransferase
VSADPELQRWNLRFAEPDYIFGTAPNRFLASKKDLFRKGERALCVADGEGRNSVWLAEQGLEVDAFDVSPLAVEKARRLAAERGVQARHEVASVDDWRWPQAAYDVVAATFVQFAGPAMRERMFERMKQALKPGGLLLIEGYTPKQLEYRTGGPSRVENLYTEALLREAFRELEILELREYEAELEEGWRHAGRSALIDLAARAQPIAR